MKENNNEKVITLKNSFVNYTFESKIQITLFFNVFVSFHNLTPLVF